MARQTARCWSSRLPGRRNLHQFAQVAPQVVAHQAQQAGRQVADDDVVRGFGDGLMKCQVGIDLAVQIVSGKGLLQLRKTLPDTFAIGHGCPLRRALRRTPFEHVAKLQHVFMDRRMVTQNLLPRIAEAGIEPVGNESSPALPAFQQAARGKFVDRLAQGSARNPELCRKITLRRQAVAGLQPAREHPLFDLARHHVCKPGRRHFCIHRGNVTLV
jgi:hypothetical protein